MSVQDTIAGVLLAGAVLVTFVSCVGVAVMGPAVDRLHYLGPVTGIAVPAVALAVLIRESPISTAGAKAILIALALMISGPLVSHAVARAARTRGSDD